MLMELTFAWLEEQIEFLQFGKPFVYDDFVFCLRPISVDNDIVHVDQSFATVDEFHQFVVHHCLECCWRVGQAKKHDGRLEKSVACFKSGLPFVAFLDADIVVSPVNIKFGEPLFTRDTMDEFGYKWERISIRDGPIVQFAVVLYWLQFPIFLFDEEEPARIG